jgi:hypothetical protein
MHVFFNGGSCGSTSFLVLKYMLIRQGDDYHIQYMDYNIQKWFFHHIGKTNHIWGILFTNSCHDDGMFSNSKLWLWSKNYCESEERCFKDSTYQLSLSSISYDKQLVHKY